jgi:hypothetical protein
MQSTRLAVSLVAGLAIAGPLAAQNSLASGAQIRIIAPTYAADRAEGTLVQVGNKMEKGAEIGAFVGGLAGTTVGILIARSSMHTASCPLNAATWNNLHFAGCAVSNSVEVVAKGIPAALAGGAAGMLLGAVVGGFIGSKSPTWQPVRGVVASPQISLDPRRPSIGLSVAF